MGLCGFAEGFTCRRPKPGKSLDSFSIFHYHVSVELLPRALESRLRRSWASFSVVVLEGPRAAGKTRLAEMLVGEDRLFRLDDAGTLAAAESSPRAWVEQLPFGSAIDEAQAVPRLSVEAKRIADDENAVPGRLLLTGSYRLSRGDLSGKDPLAGRAKRFTLWPFSQSELAAAPVDVITALFDGDPQQWVATGIGQDELRRRTVRGGFPNTRALATTELSDWAREYAPSVIGDLRTGREIDRIVRFFRWLCANGGKQRNLAEFGGANDADRKTIDSYLRELRHLFLIFDVENLADFDKRQTRTTKLYPVDPIFAAAAINMAARSGAMTTAEGPAVETFVACELSRLISASSTQTSLYWWRNNKTGDELDFVIEREDGRLVGIEVKSAREYRTQDAKGLRALRDALPHRFHRGFVMYCGDNVMSVGEDVWAAPFSLLWSVGDSLATARIEPPPLARSAELAAAVLDLRLAPAWSVILVDRYGRAALGQIAEAIQQVEPRASVRISETEGGPRSAVTELEVAVPGHGSVSIRIGLRTASGSASWFAAWHDQRQEDWSREVVLVGDQHENAMLNLLSVFAKSLESIVDRLRKPADSPQ